MKHIIKILILFLLFTGPVFSKTIVLQENQTLTISTKEYLTKPTYFILQISGKFYSYYSGQFNPDLKPINQEQLTQFIPSYLINQRFHLIKFETEVGTNPYDISNWKETGFLDFVICPSKTKTQFSPVEEECFQ